MYKIDTNVPLPTPRGRPAAFPFPFADMQVGDSFFVPTAEGDLRKVRNRLASSIVRFRQKVDINAKFSTRVVDEESVNGIRVWRVQ